MGKSMMRSSVLRAMACLMALSVATPALCQDEDARARELYEEGTRLYDLGKYEESVAAFQLAYGLSKRPQLLYNMASAMERLARWEEALEALQQYRRDSDPTAEELVSLTVRIDQLKTRIEKRDQQEALEQPPPPPDPIAPEPIVENRLPAGAWALYSGGVVGVGTAAVFTARAASARTEWKDQCVDGDARLCASDGRDAWKKDNQSSLAADISWLVGLGSIAGGVVVTLGNQRDDNLQVRLSAQPWGGGQVALGGRF